MTDFPEDEKVDGIEIAAGILGAMGAQHRQKLVKLIADRSPENAAKIRSKLIDFAKLISRSPLGVAQGLRQAEDNDIALSLKLIEPEVREELLKFVSSRRRTAILLIFEDLPPTPLRQVEGAQERVHQLIEKAIVSSKKTAI